MDFVKYNSSPTVHTNSGNVAKTGSGEKDLSLEKHISLDICKTKLSTPAFRLKNVWI
jgi:hypothetical protein